MATLFQRGQFILNSGAESSWKLECDALTDDDWDGVAAMVRHLVPQFCSVEGVPTGGLKLAERLRPFALPGVGPHLIVDDVLTTGGSMERLRGEWMVKNAGKPNNPRNPNGVRRSLIGVVLFARGQCPGWITPLFQMPETFWLKPRTRS